MKRSAKQRTLRRGEDGGIALVMVTGAIVVLTVLLAEFQEETGAEVAVASASRDMLQAEYSARSGLALARLLIATEPTIRSAITPLFAMMKKKPPQIPVWEFADQILFAFNGDTSDSESPDAGEFSSFTSGFAAGGRGKNLRLPGGHFELVVVDEDAKIDINQGTSNEISRVRLGKQLTGLFVSPQYNPLFERRTETGQLYDRTSICRNIIDWADVDELAFQCDFTNNSQNQGAENNGIYQQLKRPYRAKNAPFDSLEELHLVQGVGDDFWATFVDPDPTNPKKRIFTVWGQGAINVNTANPQTLLAVTCSGAPAAEVCTDILQSSLFITGVTMARSVTMGAPLFGSPVDFVHALTGKGQIGPLLAGMGMKPVKFQSEAEFAKTIATESKVFSVYSAGIKKGYKRDARVGIHAVLDFRTARATGAAGSNMTTGSASGVPAPVGSGGTSLSGAAGTTAGLVQPATGGILVYYRQD